MLNPVVKYARDIKEQHKQRKLVELATGWTKLPLFGPWLSFSKKKGSDN